MANIFAITTANDTIKLNADRHGEAVFTVTDTIARPLRGLVKLKPLGDTKQQWLKLAGESERDFAAGGTQQFNVMLDVPANTPPGKYGFRLDVVSTVNPDEHFTEGPTVTAEFLPPKARPPSKAWMIPVALIVLALIVGGIVWIATRKKTVTVPPVEGLKIEQARDLLKKAQLQFKEAQVPATNQALVGTVKSAIPKPGETVELTTSVALEVYGPVKLETVADVLAAKGEALANADPLATELRNREPEGPSRRGFYIGLAAAEGHTLPGPGKDKIRDSLSPAEQLGFNKAVEFSLERNKNNNLELAAKGAAIAKADLKVAEVRNVNRSVIYWQGFDVATGIFGDPALGALGNTLRGPGSDKIRDSLSPQAREGFEASVKFHLSRNYKR